MDNSWKEVLKDELNKDYYKKLLKRVEDDYNKYTVYPPKEDILKALELTKYEDVKVVILGQDPYHGKGEAMGLAFSVRDNIKLPPSLKNIFKELNDDLNIPIPKSGDLTNWAKNNVLLLNTILTVIEDKPLSHKNIGWEIFTNQIIKKINEKDEAVVYILLGGNAKEKSKLITNPHHHIIYAPHPSPLSAYRGFFGSKIFSKTNQILKENNQKEIDWRL